MNDPAAKPVQASPTPRRQRPVPLLQARGLSRHYGGIRALDDLSLDIYRGEIFALIGPNGAGKTTFFDILTGFCTPDEGGIVFDQVVLPRGEPHLASARGIARSFQNIRLFGELTALENVLVGAHRRLQAGAWDALLRTRRTREEEAGAAARARELLDYVGLAAHAGSRADALSYGDRRRLEIARALAAEPLLLALDEPAAGMNASETVALAALIRRIRDDGTTVLLIEHDMTLVMSLCDRVAVLDAGRKIAEGPPAAVRDDPAVIEAYLGRGRHAR